MLGDQTNFSPACEILAILDLLHCISSGRSSIVVLYQARTYKVASQHKLESHTFRVSVQGAIYFIY